MEKLLISLWFGTIALSQHLSFHQSHIHNHKVQQFKNWLLTNGLDIEFVDKLISFGITNLDILKCVGDDLEDLSKISSQLDLSLMEKIQFKTVAKMSLNTSSSILNHSNSIRAPSASPRPKLKGLLSGGKSKNKESKDRKTNSPKKVKNLDTEEIIAITKLTQKIKDMEQSIKLLQQQSKNIDNDILKTSKRIETTFIEIMNEVEKCKQNLLKQLTKIGQSEKKKLNQQTNILQQQYVSSNKKLDHCTELIQNNNADTRKAKILEISTAVCKVDIPSIAHSNQHKFIDSNLETAKLLRAIHNFGTISVHNDIMPRLISLEQRDSLKLNKLSIKWNLDNSGRKKKTKKKRSIGKEEQDGDKETILLQHKLCIECAYLPFNTNVEEEKDLDFDFDDNLEINLSRNHLDVLNEKGECSVTIEIPNEKKIYLLRIKYFDGKQWTNYSNYKYLKYEPKLNLKEIELKFDPKQRKGKYLQFNLEKEKHSVKCTKHDNLYHSCLFGMEIKKTMCNIFKIKFKILSYGKYSHSSDFFIGFTTSNSKESIRNYDQAIGCGANKQNTIGIRVYGKALFLYDKSNSKTKINYEIRGDRYKINDNFRFIFNFINNTWIFCHDMRQIFARKLNTNCIIPAITLGNQDEEIQIASYEFQ